MFDLIGCYNLPLIWLDQEPPATFYGDWLSNPPCNNQCGVSQQTESCLDLNIWLLTPYIFNHPGV